MEATPQRLNTSQSEGSLSRMSDKRREKLMAIKMREDLKDELATKFKYRFAHGGGEKDPDAMSVSSAAIRNEVNQFGRLQHLTEANLSRLERRMKGRAQGKLTGEDATSMAGVSAYSGGSMRSRSSTTLAGQAMVNSHPLEGLPPMDWTKLDEYAGYVHEQDCLRKQVGGKAIQRKMKLDLDQQILDKAQKKVVLKEEDQRHHQNSMLELERWKQMEQLRASEHKAKLMREKADRDEQLNFDRQVKAEQSKQKMEEELNLVEKIVVEMQAEQEKFEQKKKETKEAMRKVFEDNEADKKQKDEASKIQREKDAAALIEYARAQEEQEEKRAAELQERMDKQNALMKKLMSNVEGIKKGAGDNDHKRALAQQEEMDRHFFEAEQIKQDRLKQMRLENQAYLLRQIEEKQSRKDDDTFLMNIQSMILEKDSNEYNEIEKRKQIERRLRNHEHKKDIEKQMEYKLKQSVPLMSENEMRINKPLLHMVHKTLTNRDANAANNPTIPEGDEDDL